jgi:hypothetical protein
VKNYPKALQNGTLAFGFSAGGLLFPVSLPWRSSRQQAAAAWPPWDPISHCRAAI